MDSLIRACKDLLIKEPFYGTFLLNLRKELVPENHEIQTASVAPNGINFTVCINEKFWNNLTPAHRIAILTHEVLHLAFGHCTEHWNVDDQQTMNVAMDVEINQYIDNLPENGWTLKKLSELLNEKLEPRKGSMYYYKKIQQFKQNNPDNNLDNNTLDDHTAWPKDMSDAERILLKNQIEHKLKETAETIKKQGRHIPNEMSELLKRLEKPPVFN